ncbi:MAG TPA: DUF5682 family protein, partial [Minicystis sp.]|nr:DUF5682 family protein [Minicystis sp.]
MKGAHAALARVHLVPIRHHSPRSSAVLAAVLDRVKPAVVLVEGPEDATPLVPVLVDDATRPPIAILAYRTDKKAGSCLWPFASYSPEWVALKWAKDHGAESAFIDVPAARVLAEGRRRGAVAEIDEGPDVHDRAAEASGFRSFEELWEARFEAPDYDFDAFRDAIVAYAELARAAERDPSDAARDAFMVRRIEEAARRVDAERVVVVAGAAHVAAWAAGDIERGADKTLPKPVPCETTIVPYSFPRLAEQLGYGAGNRAPMYYQRAHDAGCSYDRATLEALLDFAQHLRLRGFSASLADALEGYRLARTLAGLREKAAPGVDELRDAAVATLCKGDATHVDGFLWPAVVGTSVGRVAARVGKNSLEEEFWRTVRDKKLPASDALEAFSLRLGNAVEVETSVFLHRLRVAGVPYASYAGAARTGARPGPLDEAGGYGALARARESWEAQWTPATDVALVE